MLDIIILVMVIAGFAALKRQQKRLGAVEEELAALRASLVGKPSEPAVAAVPDATGPVTEAIFEEIQTQPVPADAEVEEPAAGPWSRPAPAVEDTTQPEPVRQPAPRPDIETALGTRWAVWVGGLALALGALFLVRYSIESGIFGPGVRLTMSAIFGLVLLAGGEFIRRTGFEVPVQGIAHAYVPGILTAAGAFALFGTVYAAHGIYGFIGPAVAFPLLGLIGIGTIAASLVHGQALAGVGLLGALATPALVASQAPSVWGLFVYLAIVVAATVVIARLRAWALLAAAAFAGAGAWCVIYLIYPDDALSAAPVLLINVVMLFCLAYIWLGAIFTSTRAEDGAGFDWPAGVVAFFAGFAVLGLLLGTHFGSSHGIYHGVVLVAGLLATAALRGRAYPLLHAAGLVCLLVWYRLGFSGDFEIAMFGGTMMLDGFPVHPLAGGLFWAGIVVAPLFLGVGLRQAWVLAAADHVRAAQWSGWAALLPLAVATALWVGFGNLDRDLGFAAATLALAMILAFGGELIARDESPPMIASALPLAGSAAALLLALHMAFGPGMTTLLAGLAAVLPALATRVRSYPILGWLCVGIALVVLARMAVDPTIVGAAELGTTPVFNWLLLGYGVPALAFGFCAWQLARTTDGRPRLAMEAAAALFALLTLAMLVRHAMNGGVIDAGAPSLAEQAIYTLIALGFGAILIAIDLRSPSPVMRYGSLAIGVISAVLIVEQHLGVLNPLFTGESTGRIVFFNLLFLAYLLPAAAAGALAYYARGKRPRWYSAMLALVAALLAFAYATLSLRRFFQGEFIPLWKGMGQVETYSYSALWLVMGVALLMAGVRLQSHVLRAASGVLIAVAVAKVFLFDMRELEGVLRALSFIGLGAVLIGIGLFYQRLLTRAAQ